MNELKRVKFTAQTNGTGKSTQILDEAIRLAVDTKRPSVLIVAANFRLAGALFDNTKDKLRILRLAFSAVTSTRRRIDISNLGSITFFSNDDDGHHLAGLSPTHVREVDTYVEQTQ